MIESTNKHTKTYLHLCFECEKEFDTEQRTDNCLDCNKPFKEVWEHLVFPSIRSRLYYHQCSACKIRFDTDEEEQNCPHCNQPSKNIGFVIRDSFPPALNTFWGKLKHKLKEFMP